MLTPQQPGPLDLTVTIEYTDDFNMARTIVKTLTVEVMEALPFEPGMEGGGGGGGESMPLPAAPETFWQVVWRFIRGLLGLDSSRADGCAPAPGGLMPEGAPTVAPQAVPVGP